MRNTFSPKLSKSWLEEKNSSLGFGSCRCKRPPAKKRRELSKKRNNPRFPVLILSTVFLRVIELNLVPLAHFLFYWSKLLGGGNFAHYELCCSLLRGCVSQDMRSAAMPDLTLSDLRALSQKELKRRLKEEACKLFGPEGHRALPCDDLCPLPEKDLLSVRRSFFQKFLSGAKEAPREDHLASFQKTRASNKTRKSSG